MIPTHNRAEVVGRAIDSVLAQEGVATPEVIVVDDASTDATPALLAGYGDAVRVLRLDQNVERATARNLGAEAAGGAILAFLDSDDEWDPRKLARQLPRVAPGTAVVTGARFVDLAGRRAAPDEIPPPAELESVVRRNHYPPSSMVLLREDFERAGRFPTEWAVQGSEDWLFAVHLLAAGMRIEVVPDPLLLYRLHADNWTAEPSRIAVSMWAVVESMASDGIVEGELLATVRTETAELIARRFANARHLGSAWHWTLRAWRWAPVSARPRVVATVLVAGLRGAVRRGLLRRRPAR